MHCILATSCHESKYVRSPVLWPIKWQRGSCVRAWDTVGRGESVCSSAVYADTRGEGGSKRQDYQIFLTVSKLMNQSRRIGLLPLADTPKHSTHFLLYMEAEQNISTQDHGFNYFFLCRKRCVDGVDRDVQRKVKVSTTTYTCNLKT